MDIEAAIDPRGGSSESQSYSVSSADTDCPSASIGAVAVHCFFVAAVAGCFYAAVAATNGPQNLDDGAGWTADQFKLPGAMVQDARQDLRSAITFALGGLMTFFAQSGGGGSGRQAVKRLNIVASLI